MSPALPGFLPAFPGAPRCVVGAPTYSEGRQQCPPRVWYSPEIDASKFTLHILSDPPGGFQWLKYISLMLCNMTRHLGDGWREILCQRVRGSVRVVRAIRNTRVILMETRVVADEHARHRPRAMGSPNRWSRYSNQWSAVWKTALEMVHGRQDYPRLSETQASTEWAFWGWTSRNNEYDPQNPD